MLRRRAPDRDLTEARPLYLGFVLLLAIILAGLIGTPPELLPAGTPPEVVGLFDPLRTDSAVRMLVAAATGVFFFALAGFVIPAVGDAIGLAGIANRLHRLLDRRSRGGDVAPAEIQGVFLRSPLELAGVGFTAQLRREIDGDPALPPGLRSAEDPGTWFAGAIELRAAAARLPDWGGIVLVGIGLGGFAHTLALPDSAPAMHAGSVAAIGAAGILALAARLVSVLRRQRIVDIVGALRMLAPPLGDELVAAKLGSHLARGAESVAAELAQTRAAFGTALAASLRELAATLKAQEQRNAAVVAGAVETAIRPLSESFAQSLQRIEAAETRNAEEMLGAVLEAFVAEFESRFSAQLAGLGAVIDETRRLAEEMKGVYTQSASQLGQQSALLTEHVLGSVGSAVRDAADTQSARLSDALAGIEAATNAIADALQRLPAGTPAIDPGFPAEALQALEPEAKAAFAREIAQLGDDLPALSSDPAVAEGFARALDDLRQETDLERQSLPRL